MRIIEKIVRSVRIACVGLLHAYRADESFRLEILLGIPVYAVLGYFLSPLSMSECFWFAFSYGFILVVELLNTSIEVMLERLHPEEHELIGRSKDIASAAVLLTFLFALFVIVHLFLARM